MSGGGTTTTATGGDSVLLAKASDNLNLGDTWGVFTGSVDDDDLKSILADGTYVADDNDEFDFEQKIELGAPTLAHFRDSDYESLVGLSERTPTVGFRLTSGTHVLNYTLDFTQDAESDVSGTDLDDLEGSDLTLFGKNFYISDWKNGTAAGNTGKLTLLDSAVTSSVAEGESVSVTSGDSTYSVSLEFIGSATVKFNVNGEVTNTLNSGETFRLSDNAYIGVREINTQDYQGGIKTVEFSIGSGKLELTHAADLKLNDETLTGVSGYLVKGTYSDAVQKINKIVIKWDTDEEEFVTPETELEMPGFGGVKFTMSDFARSVEEKVTVAPDGDNSIEITVPIKDGMVSFNLLYSTAAAGGNFTGIGKAADERLATTSDPNSLVFYEKQNSADYHEWFVASYNISSEAESYLLRARITKDTTDNRNETDIDKRVGGDWVEVCNEKIAGDSCDIGQVTLNIGTIAKTAATESVNISGGTNVNFNTIYTAGGLRIYLPFEANASTASGAINLTQPDDLPSNLTKPVGHSTESWYLEFDGENKDEDIAGGTAFNMTLDNTASTNNPLHVSEVNRGGTGGPLGLEIGDTSTYEVYVVDDVAPRILHYTNPDEDWAEVYYPRGDSESFAEVFLAETGTVFTAGVAGGGVGSLGDVLVKDSEVSSVSSKHLIVVGGSCINSAAANLVGGALCGSSWESSTGAGSGQFLIQSFGDAYSSGKVALLVAGYNAADTVNAATYLRNQAVDTAAGMKYIGTSSTSAELQVS
jgi:hypothetical protein